MKAALHATIDSQKLIGKSSLGEVKKGRESYCDILRKGKSAKEEEDASQIYRNP